jgi:serine/threonine protein kinase
MDIPSPLALHPALLPPGTAVGSWRVEAWAGCGVFGAVYRAVASQGEDASPVALKLALLPADPRFAREVELLSRCDHPSLPRLLGQGSWQSPSGTLHPFLVMQWVDGVPLYDQARLHPPHPPQVRLWLAQLAQALAALHAQGALHRDFKGDNVLVRRSDGRAMLMDLGTGLYPGAAPITPAMGFPGTPIYRSPESWLFELRFYRSSTARYVPAPADDLYALGVTACHLLTGAYPEPAAPFRDAHGLLHLENVLLPPSLLKNPHIDPALRAVILRLLSIHPEQRGTAAQLAQELEQSLRPFQPRPSADSTAPSRPHAPARSPWLAWTLAAAGLALAVGAWWPIPGKPQQPQSLAHLDPSGADSADAGTTGLGEAATALAMEKPPPVSTAEAMSEDALPEPIPGQVRPDEKGRCPSKGLVSLNGGCWNETAWEPEKCLELGGEMFKGTCYVPFIPPRRKRPPTSAPMKKR